MNRKYSIAIFCIVAALALPSCKKEYICHCRSYQSGQETQFSTKDKMTRSQALKYCNSDPYIKANGFSCGLE